MGLGLGRGVLGKRQAELGLGVRESSEGDSGIPDHSSEGFWNHSSLAPLKINNFRYRPATAPQPPRNRPL